MEQLRNHVVEEDLVKYNEKVTKVCKRLSTLTDLNQFTYRKLKYKSIKD